jgi:hypothetical protein
MLPSVGGGVFRIPNALHPIYAALHKKSMGRIEAGKSQPSRADSFLEVDEIGERAGYHKRIGNGLAFIVADNPGGGFGHQSVSVEV